MIGEYCRRNFEAALETIEKQACKLLLIRNGLERLRYDNSWQGADEVNEFIDSLLKVTHDEK